MFRQQYAEKPDKNFICPECKSNRFRIGGNKLTCMNCSYTLNMGRGNKYGAKRTEFEGKSYDSKFEADEAANLAIRKKAGDILDYDIQYKIEAWAYLPDGRKGFLVKHKVDFRIHHKDGSYELYEAKGQETDDYKWRRKFLEYLWLPLHPDHIYTVVRQKGYSNYKK